MINQMTQMMMNRMLNQIMNAHPEARQLYETLKTKRPEELKQYAENVAKGKNTTLNQFLNGYGITV